MKKTTFILGALMALIVTYAQASVNVIACSALKNSTWEGSVVGGIDGKTQLNLKLKFTDVISGIGNSSFYTYNGTLIAYTPNGTITSFLSPYPSGMTTCTQNNLGYIKNVLIESFADNGEIYLFGGKISSSMSTWDVSGEMYDGKHVLPYKGVLTRI